MNDEALIAVEAAMVRIRRRQIRRALAPSDHVEQATSAVVDAIDEGGEVTVGKVAERLGVDASRASRMVAQAVESGFVLRVASQRDGRSTVLELTESGQALADHIHRHRATAFDAAMAGWSEGERSEFARLLDRFVAGLSGRE